MKFKILAAAAVMSLGASAANATISIYIGNTAAGVFAQTIGSLDLTGLTFFRQATSGASVRGGDPTGAGPLGFIGTGRGGQTENGYAGITGPTSFGDTLSTGASSSTGDPFALQLTNMVVYVPVGYTSGTAINSTATWAFKTLSDLELTVGNYVFTTPHDTINLYVGQAAPAAVPEPGTLGVMFGGLTLVGAAMRRKRKA
jgi:hypothetical protein